MGLGFGQVWDGRFWAGLGQEQAGNTRNNNCLPAPRLPPLPPMQASLRWLLSRQACVLVAVGHAC